jgi:sodium transport system permease protein
MMHSAWVVFLKELLDALRDRRTLAVVLLSSVAMGPLVLTLISVLSADGQRRAEAREVVVQAPERAPTLMNYIARQTYTVKAPVADYEAQLRAGKLGHPVVVVPENFEADLVAGLTPLVEVWASSTSRHAQAGAGAAMALLRGFNEEQAGLRLALRGVSPGLLEAIRVEERDLAQAGAGAAVLANMLPFMVLMAVLYGALTAGLDTTAGERERGSLEPLLMTPAARWALVAGKWGAVAAVALLVGLLACLSLLITPLLLRNDVLATMFRFGPREALLFFLLLAPLAGAAAALLMAVAIRCQSVKEAQANVAVVMLAMSLLPLVSLFSSSGEAAWHVWVPALAQTTLMGRVLKGEAIGTLDATVSVLVCALLTALALAFVARRLRQAALK